MITKIRKKIDATNELMTVPRTSFETVLVIE